MGDVPRKLRIAFATPEYVTEDHFDGGLANYIDRVSRKLADLGHDVHVITLSFKDEDQFEHEGVMVHRLMLTRGWHVFNRLTRYTIPTTVYWLNFSTQVFRKLKQLHRKEPFHLIQYPNYSSCGVFSIPFLRTTHIVRASSYEPACNDATGIKRNLDVAIVENLQALQYRLTRHVHVPSVAAQTILSKKVSIRDARVIPSPFYVETPEWDRTVYDRFLKDKRYVLYFGRFQLHKGFHILAQALPCFFERYPEAFAVLVGRDMETQLGSSMAAFARSHCGRFADRLILVENLPHAQLYPVIDRAHLIVLPSLIDNLPNSCLEAMGLGKVVIGTKGTSMDELITDGVDGFLVEPNNHNALADKLIAAWEDPKLNQMSAAAKRKMNDFAPEKTVASLLTYYSEILNERTNNGRDYKQDSAQA
ncbi:MAG TPA: glycosyltransferase family 4 protein [Pyrinomonadaceae bacterium]|nr:glycosyltransferase family 4 protein [Pyrinomonadaceae bacterium]